jgi:hypothetical protein
LDGQEVRLESFGSLCSGMSGAKGNAALFGDVGAITFNKDANCETACFTIALGTYYYFNAEG